MQTLKIKTHRTSSAYETHHFFLLSKGYNAGKPVEKPCPHCFVVIAHSQTDKEKLFWICYCLWKSGTYLPLLVGTVIPFLPIKDVEKQINHTVSKVSAKPKEFQKLVTELQTFHKLERLLSLQLKLVTRMKSDLAYRFLL